LHDVARAVAARPDGDGVALRVEYHLRAVRWLAGCGEIDGCAEGAALWPGRRLHDGVRAVVAIPDGDRVALRVERHLWGVRALAGRGEVDRGAPTGQRHRRAHQADRDQRRDDGCAANLRTEPAHLDTSPYSRRVTCNEEDRPA